MFICDWMSGSDVAVMVFMMPDTTIRYLPLKSLSLPKIDGVGKNGPIYSGTYFTEADMTEGEVRTIFNNLINKDLAIETKDNSENLTNDERTAYENKITELDNRVNQLHEKLCRKEGERVKYQKDYEDLSEDYGNLLSRYEKVMSIVEQFKDFFDVDEDDIGGFTIRLADIY